MGPRIVTLSPITIAQECLDPSGDWLNIPPRAVTIGPKENHGGKTLPVMEWILYKKH